MTDRFHAIIDDQTMIRFEPKSIVFDQGEENFAWFEVVEGAVRLCRYLEDGTRHIDRFALAGDILGTNSEVYSASAETLQPTVLRRHALSGMDGEWLNAHAAQAIASLEQSVLLLRRPSAIQRIAAFIDRLVSRIGRGDIVDLPMSRVDIADHLGLTPSTVSRSLGTLARMGIIETDGLHRISAIDRRRLALLGGLDDPSSLIVDRDDTRLFGLAGATL
ncbi:helix-turn-helix domain-containing protein [Sphingomonas sp. FW199]|uniref:helix-turn-helix domain-containing protein n=1 Tax=Sphingomonas sp. FW199 TaxID=3400217 RepID=UPI003CE6B3BB